MLLTEQSATERLSSARNLANRFKSSDARAVKVEVLPKVGKKLDSFNFPPFIRTSIALQAKTGFESQKSIAASFGTTQANVSALKNDRGGKVDEEALETSLGTVRDAALGKLMQSLNLMDSDKLAECKAKDLSAIAANMSKVAANTILEKNDGTKISLHVYCPEPKQESSYRTIEV